MAKADVSAGKAFVSLYVKNDISKSLTKLKTELNDFGSSILGIGTKVAGMGLAITGSLTAAVMHFANVGSELNDMSVRTGISTTGLVELGYAAKQTGSGMETVETAVKKMQKSLGEIGPESKAVGDALGKIGLSVQELSGLSPEDQFQAIAEGIADVEDPTKRAALALTMFGRSGTELLPMIEDIKALRAEARELGIAPSPESIAAADAVGDAIDKMKAVVSSAVFEIGSALAPMALDIMESLTLAAKTVRKFVTENKALIVTAVKVGAVLTIAGAAIVAIGNVFIGAGMAISGLLATMSLFGGAIVIITSLLAVVLSPVGLLVAALIAGAYAWARFTNSGREAVTGLVSIVTGTFGGMLTTVTDTMGGIMDAIRAGDLALAGQIALAGLKLVFAQGLDAITNLFGETIGKLTSQVLTGDFAGAWSTLGATVLDSIASMSSGMVTLFSNAANAVMNKWQETVNAISDYILQAATEGGAMGWALEKVSGVNMQEEAARGKRIEEERRKKGMKPDNNLITDSTQYQDPALQALKDKVKAAGDAANAMMTDATDATGQALEDATKGQSETASAEVMALQAELAALKKEADTKVAAINSGSTGLGSGAGDGSGGAGGSGSVGMKGSAGTFSLAELASSAGQGVAQKQLSVAQEQKKLQEKALMQGEQMLLSMSLLGGVFP